MSTQDNLANQEKVVVNGRHIVLLVSTISFCVLIQGFLVQGCVKSSFLVEKVTV